jgi:hypothetical protein
MKPPFRFEVDSRGGDYRAIRDESGTEVGRIRREHADTLAVALNAGTEKQAYPSLWCNGEMLDAEWHGIMPQLGWIIELNDEEYRVDKITVCAGIVIDVVKISKPEITVIKEAEHETD